MLPSATSRRARSPIFLGLPVLLLAALAACGDDSSDDDPAATDAAVTSTVAETTSTTATSEPEDDHDHDEDDHDHEDEEARDHDHDEDDHDHDEDDHDHEHDEDDATVEETAADPVEVDEPRRLLVVGAHEQPLLDLIDLADGTSASLDLDAPAGFNSAITESGRFLLAGHDDGVTVVDTGVWSEPHGDHFHHYTSAPVVMGQVDGPNPTHLISHDNLNALYFDGTGVALVIAEETLEDGEVTVTAEVPTGAPHHGFAVPTHGAYVVTVPTPDMEHMPNVVGVSGTDGVVQAQFDCPSTHGEASTAAGAAVACSENILLVSEDAGTWTSSYLTYPAIDEEDPYGFGAARAWILQAAPDQSLLAAPLGSRHLLIADPVAGTTRSIDMGVPIATLGVAFTDGGDLLVLTIDGSIHLVDPATDAVVATVPVITAFEEGDPDQPYRQLAVTGDHVYVNDPATSQVIEVAVGDTLTVEDTIDLEFVPGFVTVANG